MTKAVSKEPATNDKAFGVGDRLEDGREVVYVLPNGHRDSFERLHGWLRHEGLMPGHASTTVEGWYADLITLPAEQVPMLHSLQRSNPARYGNAPEVTARLNEKNDYIALHIPLTSSAAFVDTGHKVETARILGVAANKLGEYARASEIGMARGVEQPAALSFELTDINGNVVGSVSKVLHGGLPKDNGNGSVLVFVEIPADGLNAKSLSAASAHFRLAAEHVEKGQSAGLLISADGHFAGRFLVEPQRRPTLDAPLSSDTPEP